MRIKLSFAFILLSFVLGACSTVKEVPIVSDGNFRPSSTPADSIVAQMPDYRTTLSTVKGKGKAIVSEPGNSQRVTLYFSSNRRQSLITAKNSVGIEGGQMLTDGDSLLIFNKVDNYARKISIETGNLQSINRLASINILDILNFSINKNAVEAVFENKESFLLQLTSGAKVYVGKDKTVVRQINEPASSGLPYSRILYDAYRTNEGLSLPRRITIFSADKSSKIALLIQSLKVNPELGELTIDLPDDIKMYRQ